MQLEQIRAGAGLDLGFNIVDGGAASITIGRRGGTGGVGGNVNLSYLGDLLTQGDGAFGLLAQMDPDSCLVAAEGWCAILLLLGVPERFHCRRCQTL